MISTTFNQPTGSRQTLGAAILLAGTIATIGGALAFEHVGGYMPCPLCLAQRTPYYATIPIAGAALLSSLSGGPAVLTRTLILIASGLMTWAALLGGHHTGVEWGLWAGPSDCAVGSFDLSGDLLAQIDTVRPPSCTEAALFVFGLSLAAWNMMIASLLTVIGLRAGLARSDRFAVRLQKA